MSKVDSVPPNTSHKQPPIPLWFLAELTYRCPQQCPYCSNPVNFSEELSNELSSEQWCDVMRQARKLGAAQLGFSGGEPLIRKDLEELVACARELGFYTNLITSGIGLNKKRLKALRAAGLDHVQLSIDSSNAQLNQRIVGVDAFDEKIATAKIIKDLGYAMVLNVVLHRENIHEVGDILSMALGMGADYVELANVQYYGWAMLNRSALMPSREQLKAAEATTQVFREQHGDKMKVFFVVPDYYEKTPKRCNNGWGTTFITVTPQGDVLPCQSAKVIPGLEFPNVRAKSLQWIWRDSKVFNQYRGTEWMREPCRSCDKQLEDLGGCRCQALMLTAEASNADPVCEKSTHHDIVRNLLIETNEDHTVQVQNLIYRNTKNAKQR